MSAGRFRHRHVNGVFGFRSEPWDMNKLVERLSDSGQFGKADAAESELLHSAFPHLRCVQLTREDKVRQAVSKARAMQTNLWLATKEKMIAGEPQFDPALIAQCEQAATQAEKMWAAFFRAQRHRAAGCDLRRALLQLSGDGRARARFPASPTAARF
jgi:LPS sulfotransferase NodH